MLYMYMYLAYTYCTLVLWFNCVFVARQLRSSCHEADSKLAQIIKEIFLPRVKVATKVPAHAIINNNKLV